MSVTYVPPERVRDFWFCVEPIVQRAIDKIDFGFGTDDILKSIEQGKRQLWVLTDSRGFAAGITHISERASSNIGVMAIGGADNVEMMDDFIPHLVKFFKSRGCTEIELIGRAGWVRYMNKHGFKQKYISTARKIV